MSSSLPCDLLETLDYPRGGVVVNPEQSLPFPIFYRGESGTRVKAGLNLHRFRISLASHAQD